ENPLPLAGAPRRSWYHARRAVSLLRGSRPEIGITIFHGPTARMRGFPSLFPYTLAARYARCAEHTSREGGRMGKLSMTRRSFAQMAAVVGATAAMGAGTTTSTALAEGAAAQTSGTGGEAKKIRSCCRGCGEGECGVWVYVQDGKVIRTEGDEDCFLTMGNHCSKGQASIQAAYHPDHIKYPMKRTNPKVGEDPGWVRISWDEAYQTIADNIMQIR